MEKISNLGSVDKNLSKSNIFLFDALGTTVTLHDPYQTLKGDDYNLYTLSETPFSSEAVKNLPGIIKALGLGEDYKRIISELRPLNLPEKRQYYVLCDKLAESYCKKNNDNEQLMRMEVIKKIYHLVDPEIFSKVMEYSKQNFGKSLKLLLLTNANPLLKEVYKQMVSKYGVDVLVVPNPLLDKLRKEDPQLYAKISELYKTDVKNLGLLDDKKLNTDSIELAGGKGELLDADGKPLESKEGIEELNSSAKKLVNKLLDSSGQPINE